MKNVYLTSFFKSHGLPDGVVPYSAAVYQPKGYGYPKVPWTDIRPDGGQWIRPREFLSEANPLDGYRKALLDLYGGRKDEACAWRDSLAHDVALCCWCPYDRAAQRQLGDFGSFVCHTAVLGEFIYNELGVAVWEDADRRKMAVLTQRHSGVGGEAT